MSLSPLCPGQTTRFARQDGGQPPPRFPKALLCPGIAHHLSANMYAHTQTFLPKDCGRRIVPQEGPTTVTFITRWSLPLHHSHIC